MDFRKTFDHIPEQFDKNRPRYCPELFAHLADVCGLGPASRVLEIGPGTGQATEPILRTGCDYTGVELGERFAAFLRERFAAYPNCHIRNDDFETAPLPENAYDLVYSAATIQWIPEEIAFPRAFRILKPGGRLAMFMTRSDERSANPGLSEDLERVYREHFHVERHYTCRMTYENALRYGFVDLRYREWKQERVLDEQAYIDYIGTHCEHITLEEPYRSRFFAGVREVVRAHGGRVVIRDTIPLYLLRKPEEA